MWVLVDTNVFLDLLLNREPSSNDVKKFFRYCQLTKTRVYVTSMSLRDIEYTIHHIYHDKLIARRAVNDVYSLCSKVIGISADDAIESIFSSMKDYEDSLIVEAAKREMMNLIVTNNIKDFKDCKFPVWTPKEFNEVIEKESN